MKVNKPLLLFIASLMFLSFVYGLVTVECDVFPNSLIKEAKVGYKSMMKTITGKKDWYYQPAPSTPPVQGKMLGDELNLVTRVAKDQMLAIELRDMGGKIVHSWHVDWFDNWPDATHTLKWATPKERPGTHVHGAAVTPDKGLVFNFENCGMLKMDYEGNVLWRVPVATGHCVYPYRGYYWACAIIDSDVMRQAPFQPGKYEPQIIKVDDNGKIVRKIGMVDLLLKNGLNGLVCARGRLDAKNDGSIQGDFLHLNNVEVFPDDMEEGFFKHGDIMVSMRNISTIVVFDPETEKIKFRVTGTVNHQHDPDFVDGNTITVFDNNPYSFNGEMLHSRIVEIKAPGGEQRVVFKGTADTPFYTNIMGMHQHLPNGDILITESKGGRAIEISPQGEIVWEFRNTVEDGWVGLLSQVDRLSPEMSALFRE